MWWLKPACKKVKQSRNTYIEAKGERRYSSYSFTTSALDGREWSASRPGCALPRGKDSPIPTVQEAGWAWEPVCTQRLEEKSSLPPPGIEPQSPSRPVRSHTLYYWLSYPDSSKPACIRQKSAFFILFVHYQCAVLLAFTGCSQHGPHCL
jgi:hypothetical protein